MNISLKKNFMRAMAYTVIPAIVACQSPVISSAQAAPHQFELGMNFLWDKGDQAKLESSFQRMKELGIKTARTDFEWRVVEAKKGIYDWSKPDRLMKLAQKYDIDILPIVHYAPTWALPNISKPNGIYEVALSENAYGDYAKFLNAAIDRYGPNGNAPFPFKPVTNWQVWNEPNNKDFWYINPGWFKDFQQEAASQFVKFMDVVSSNLGDRRNRVKIVHAGLSKSDTTYMWHLWDKDKNYCNKFDVMAVHSYFFSPNGGVRGVEEVDQGDANLKAMGFVGGDKDHGYLPKVNNVKRFMELKKCSNPVWVTEIGFMANKTGPVSGNPWVVKEDKASQLTGQTLDFFQNRTSVDKVFWFILDDYDFPNATGNFGVYDTPQKKRDGVYNEIYDYTHN